MAISYYLANQFMKAALQGVPFTPPEEVYLALFVTNPTAGNSGQEVSGGAYARQLITFQEVPVQGGYSIYQNDTDIEYPVATTSWDTISFLGVYDALTGGNLLWYMELDQPRLTLPGDNATVYAGSVQIQFED